MTVGMFMAGLAFVAAALVQIQIDVSTLTHAVFTIMMYFVGSIILFFSRFVANPAQVPPVLSSSGEVPEPGEHSTLLIRGWKGLEYPSLPGTHSKATHLLTFHFYLALWIFFKILAASQGSLMSPGHTFACMKI